MTNEEYAKIVAKNLKRIFYEHNRTQTQVAKELNLNKKTLSSYMNAKRVPKMATIDLLCHYFNCSRSDIMEPHDYYTNPETADAAQELFDSELRALLDAAKGNSPDNIRKVTEILKALKETNPNG